jgi:hypothetical protein
MLGSQVFFVDLAPDGGLTRLASVVLPDPAAPGTYALDAVNLPLVTLEQDCAGFDCRRFSLASSGTLEVLASTVGDGGLFVGRLSGLRFVEASSLGLIAGSRCQLVSGTVELDAGF